MAVLIQEPESGGILEITKDSILLPPQIIEYEIGNALSKLYKRHILNKEEITLCFKRYRTIPIKMANVNTEKSLEISCKFNIYAYDVYYLETALRLNLPLLTLDERMKKVGKELNLNILEVK